MQKIGFRARFWGFCAFFGIFLAFCMISFGNLTVYADEESDNQSSDEEGAEKLAENQKKAISESCVTIIDNLKSIQHYDSRIRTHLGPIYDEILNNYMMPLNRRLASNNIGDASLTENQTSFASAKTTFVSDYVEYQKELETLVAIDCKEKPEDFYRELVKTRKKRASVKEDVEKIDSLTSSHVELVKMLRNQL